MLEWLINYSKWCIIFTVLLLLIITIYFIVHVLKDRMEFCPDTILIQCNKCGKTHELKVIKIFSNWYKGKYVTWCSNKHKFDTLYYCGKTKNYIQKRVKNE